MENKKTSLILPPGPQAGVWVAEQGTRSQHPLSCQIKEPFSPFRGFLREAGAPPSSLGLVGAVLFLLVTQLMSQPAANAGDSLQPSQQAPGCASQGLPAGLPG